MTYVLEENEMLAKCTQEIKVSEGEGTVVLCKIKKTFKEKRKTRFPQYF